MKKISPQYIAAALRSTRYEQISNDVWYASIPGFAGLWATGGSKAAAFKELSETLPGWIDVHVTIGRNPLPKIEGQS